MKLTLNKSKLKTLSQDKSALPENMTPKIVGGGLWDTQAGCVPTYKAACRTVNQWCGPSGVC
ncbi:MULTISPECIES: hypothetical protein [unclassified Pseudoalteromonas]|uniref:hypothetical protein n=1 Tax=unclassified Pseudoalteromonas TaxID=194690 RepID=UPI001B39F76F|nr:MULTISPECIES: hypothetical protein [unclassified Pseudoalteromonas]MBQ4846557.1 hypothetical protein [Pseudoalteromonas sp. MMG005]MBQ4851095.1 hypothetical protein [Pseudoalteromonas sp. MMG012]